MEQMHWLCGISCFEKHCRTRCIHGQKAMEHDTHEGRITCQVCGYPTNYLLKRKVSLF
jgi:hypothetical protein